MSSSCIQATSARPSQTCVCASFGTSIYCPTKVDKQLGWVVRNPRFRPNLNIQPIKKINGISPQPPNIDWKPFNLIWAFSEWLEHDILEIWDFGKMSGSHFPKKRKKTWCLKKSSFARIQNPTFLPSIQLFHIYGKIDLGKLITTNPIWDFFTETFDLLSARPFENLVFRH